MNKLASFFKDLLIKALAVALAMLMGVVGAYAQVEDQAGEQAPDQERQKALVHLVKQDCGSCHGMTLKGGLGPALTKDVLANKPDLLLINTILYGREALAMPPWKGILSEAEVVWMVDLLKNEGIQ